MPVSVYDATTSPKNRRALSGMNGRQVTIACLVTLRRSDTTRTTRPKPLSARAAVGESAPVATTMLDCGTKTARPSSPSVKRERPRKLSSVVPG